MTVLIGCFGLLIGSFLNVVIYRVPAGKSLMPSSRCPNCDAAVRPWQNVPVFSWLMLRGKCAECRAPISARYPLVELGTGVFFALVTYWLLAAESPGSGWDAASFVLLATCLVLASVSVALTLIDLDTLRLPNAIVYPSIVAVAALLAITAILASDLSALVRALLGGLALSAFYGLLWFFWEGGMGLGDVKLAVLLGLALGWFGWGSLIVGAFAAFLCGGVYGIALILAGKATRTSRVPFGPWMMLGAWIGLFWGETIANWYLTSFFGA